MAAYESDSSDGEFTETNVLLGYASKDAGDDVLSRLGGRPDWLDAANLPTAGFARCKVCKDLMVLLLQLNGELPEQFPGHDRRIYVFTCRRKTCRRKNGSVRALRATRVWKEEASKARKSVKEENEKRDNKKEEPKSSDGGPGIGEALFGATTFGGAATAANPFSSAPNPFSTSTSLNSPFNTASAATPFSSLAEKVASPEPATSSLSKTFAETLSLNTELTEPPPPPEQWPSDDAQPAPYPTLYLSEAEYETLDPTPSNIPANARLDDADAAEPSILDREAFESTMDSAFQKFADRLAQNPDQAIRYEFSGAPLLYSKTDAVGAMLSRGGMPGCGNCGGRRTFEVQLTPHAITELEADEMDLDGMEWGTVIVGVCEKDCVPRKTEDGQVGYLEEWVGVQWEELAKNK